MTEFLADLAEARADAAALRSEIRTLRKAKADKGAIRAVGQALRDTERWLWATRFAADRAENGDEDAEKAATAAANRGEGPVPF